MHNPIRRFFKPECTTRTIDLHIGAEADSKPSAACEVTEFDALLGWEQWNDSIFVQDFEDSVLTQPIPLFVESQPSQAQVADMLAPFNGFEKLF